MATFVLCPRYIVMNWHFHKRQGHFVPQAILACHMSVSHSADRQFQGTTQCSLHLPMKWVLSICRHKISAWPDK